MDSKELNRKLLRLFGLGWEIGNYQTTNQPISYEDLRRAMKPHFEERDRLIAEITQ